MRPSYNTYEGFHPPKLAKDFIQIIASIKHVLSLWDFPRQTSPLGGPFLPCYSLPPCRPSIPGLELINLDFGPLRRSANLPVTLAVHIPRPQLQVSSLLPFPLLLRTPYRLCSLQRLACLYLSSLDFPNLNMSLDLGSLLAMQLHLRSDHSQAPSPYRVPRQRQNLIALKDDTDVLPLRVLLEVFVVLYISTFRGVDGVVAAHSTVLTREPVRAALAEDDVARDDILLC